MRTASFSDIGIEGHFGRTGGCRRVRGGRVEALGGLFWGVLGVKVSIQVNCAVHTNGRDNVWTGRRCMDKSTKIQLRISVEALAAFDAEAKAQGMTRTAFLINSAWKQIPLRKDHYESDSDTDIRGTGSDAGDSTQRARHRTSVPLLPAPTSSQDRLHSVQPMRNELAARGGHLQRPETQQDHAGHRLFKAGHQQYCSDCRSYF